MQLRVHLAPARTRGHGTPTLGAGPALAPALAPPPIPYAAKKAGSTRRGPAWGAVQGQCSNDRASTVGRSLCRRLRSATGSPAGPGAAAGPGALPAPGLALATPELIDAEGGGAYDREGSKRVKPSWLLGAGKHREVLAFHKLHTTHHPRQVRVRRQWAPPWSDQEQPPKVGVSRHHPLHLPHVHPGPLEARA